MCAIISIKHSKRYSAPIAINGKAAIKHDINIKIDKIAYNVNASFFEWIIARYKPGYTIKPSLGPVNVRPQYIYSLSNFRMLSHFDIFKDPSQLLKASFKVDII